MKQLLSLIALSLFLLPASPARAVDITTLLTAAASQPGMDLSEIAVEESRARASGATAALYPKIDLFGRAETYNSPTNLRPMSPTEVNIPAGDSIPFSHNILRYGIHFEMPVYVRQVYLLREKMQLLTEKAELARKINLVSGQAAVVSLDSGFGYLRHLDLAVKARLKSLHKTRADIALKVKNGRTAAGELMKIDNSLLALQQQQNELTARILDVQRDLYKLTGLTVASPVPMQMVGKISTGPFIATEKDKKDVAAAEKEVARRRWVRYPALSLYGTVSGNHGEAYNTEEQISRTYNFAGLVLKVPLFDQSLGVDERLARMQLKKTRKKLAAAAIELQALAVNLDQKIPVVEQSLLLAKKAAANSEQLLVIARVAYESGRMTSEEYLRHEFQLLASRAAVYKARDQRWQIAAKQAVLFGTDLKGIVK